MDKTKEAFIQWLELEMPSALASSIEKVLYKAFIAGINYERNERSK